jgi:uncharacterized protein (TIGR00725 family)
MRKTITIFGSSLPLPGEQEYEDAYLLGKLLAQKGFSVCTGGNLGIMEAASKGASAEGAEVIGIVFDHFSTAPNAYLTEIVKTKSLFERIENLVGRADGFVVLQGGTGTLLEFAVVWEFCNKELLSVKPIACHSELWRQIILPMEAQIKREKRRTGLVHHFPTVQEIAEYMEKELCD